MKIRTWLTYEPKEGKKFTQPSMTVPDQSMNMREIMDRFAKGLPLPDQKTELWDEESDGIDPRTLDLVDLQEIKMKNSSRLKDLEVKHEDEKKKHQERKQKEKEDSEKSLFEKFKNSLKGDDHPEGQ